MRKAFTLVELLVIIGIMAAMVTMSVISVRSGQDAYRLKGSTRDILAKVRYARSMALVSRQSVKLVYSNETLDDGESAAKITMSAVEGGFVSKTIPTDIETLSGKPLAGAELSENTEETTLADNEGTSITSILEPDLDSSLVHGVKIKAVGANAAIMAMRTDVQQRSRISISGTNVKMHDLTDEEASEESSSSQENYVSTDGEISEVTWNSLGATDEHTIYVYTEGTDFTNGYKIHVDEMGGIKVYGPSEEIED